MIFQEALAWILDPAHWSGNGSIPQRLMETLAISGISLLIALLIAVPLGIYIGHTGRGRSFAIILSNVARALPTLGLLSILILVIGVNWIPVAIVLVVLGIPPMLAGVYAGFESVNRDTIDAARAIGMTEAQIIGRVEIPLAAPLLVGGLRACALQIVATTTVASAFAFGGFGAYLVRGLAQADWAQMLAGAILITVLCLILDGLLSVLQRLVAPRDIAAARRTPNPRQPAGVAIPQEGLSS